MVIFLIKKKVIELFQINYINNLDIKKIMNSIKALIFLFSATIIKYFLLMILIYWLVS